MSKYLTPFGMAALRTKIARLEQRRDEALGGAGDAAQNDPNSYHDNFEYEESMRQQEMFSRRIRSMWEILQGTAVAAAPASDDHVSIGHWVTVRFADGCEDSFVLCGDGEGSLWENACSIASPIGKALLGMARGESRGVYIGGRSVIIEVIGIRTAAAEDFRETGGEFDV